MPLIQLAFGDARNAIAAPTSSGCAETAERQFLLHELRDAFRIGLLPLPPRAAFEQDRARRHRDHANLILRQLLRERFGRG